MRLQQFYPILLAWHAFRVYIAYPQSKTVENDDDIVGAADEWTKQYFYYVYTTSGTGVTSYNTDETSRQMYIWLAAWCSSLIN